MMSGTDLSLYGVVRPFYRPRQYAHRLAESLGCPTADSYIMMNCLRATNLTWEDFVREQSRIIPNVSLAGTLSAIECSALLISMNFYSEVLQNQSSLHLLCLYCYKRKIVGYEYDYEQLVRRLVENHRNKSLVDK